MKVDLLPWHPNDDDHGYRNRECQIKRLRVNKSQFTSDIYPTVPAPTIQPVFADDIVIPTDVPTVVNHLDVGSLHKYWDSTDVAVNAVAIDNDDPSAIRGQFDSGADASVTNLLIYLHKYRPYTPKFKCPVKLTGAVGSEDLYPLGEGFLHLPAPTPCGFLAVRCFYSPHLSSTLVSPRDLLKISQNWQTSFSGQDMKTYFGPNGDPNFGRCTLTCHHAMRRSQNIVIDGVVMNGNCYTYPLILPDVDINNLQATAFNSLEYTMAHDDDFFVKCATATTDAIDNHRKVAFSDLDIELQAKSTCVAAKCKQLRISQHFDNIALRSALDATPFR